MKQVRPLGSGVNNSGLALDLFSFLLFLFFIQQLTFLVEAIYTLNLLHTSIDGRVLGLLFLTLPVLLFIIKHNRTNYIIIISIILICTVLSPLIPTPIRIYSSGIGAGLFLLYLALQFSDRNLPSADWGNRAALATLTSIAFRVAGHTLDISISGNTKFIGWILVLTSVMLFCHIIKKYPQPGQSQVQEGIRANDPVSWFSVLGLAGSVLLIYFALSSPGVIARWTEGNYRLIHLVLCTGLLIFLIPGPGKVLRYSRNKELLLGWNTIFLLLLILTILLHRVPFPSLPDSAPVVVGESTLFSRLITYLMLILSPVIFINISVFSQAIKPTKPSNLAGPFLVAVLLIILSVFILIFSNTWGYAKPVSSLFRNQFHLPFILAGIFTILPYIFIKRSVYGLKSGNSGQLWSKVLSLILVWISFSVVFSGKDKQVDAAGENIKELTLMTYNVQQGVDFFGNKNYDGQLALIAEIDPDIICLQESDASRISGGNSDVVRFFAHKLGFYSYYGPTTVSGTYGTAILSRFPLDSCRTLFSYSTKDEIGTAISRITVGNKEITLINSHPAGKEEARQAHINAVSELAKANKMVIALGDYNFRQDSPYYQKITGILNDAWLSIYPDAIGHLDNDKVDSSFKNRTNSSGQLLSGGKLDMQNRIDHIFLSGEFKVVEAHYLPAPESGTDHPAHWAVVRW